MESLSRTDRRNPLKNFANGKLDKYIHKSEEEFKADCVSICTTHGKIIHRSSKLKKNTYENKTEIQKMFAI